VEKKANTPPVVGGSIFRVVQANRENAPRSKLERYAMIQRRRSRSTWRKRHAML